MLCSRCKKRDAIIFVSCGKNSSETQGLCVKCAKELSKGSFKELIESIDITDKDIAEIQSEVSDMFNFNPDDMPSIDEDLSSGSSSTVPMIKSLFSNILFPDKDKEENSNDSGKSGADKTNLNKKGKRKNLDLYCNNLTSKAARNELDRVIGRDKEINRAIQILCRRTKNNPCLIGEPGVGKTAIAEGLAILINEGKVPYMLKNKEIHLLDLTALVAGTQFRGQFEGRIRGLVEEVKKDGNIILFIDEVHNLVGAGDSEGSMSAANILKPALSRGEIQVIGATTFTEYRKYIEKDSALERRFQTIKIEEPNIPKTIEILKGIKDYYEAHHRVSISDDIIRSIVVLSERYVTDRFLPDKAIDIMDEACTCAALNNKDLANYDEISSKIDNLKKQEEKLSSSEEVDYESLAEVRCELAQANKDLDAISTTALGRAITHDDVAKVIELWTGIPSSKIEEQEFSKLEFLEDNLKSKIIGQDEAVSKICSAIRRNRLQIGPRRRPVSFIFAGPTGVGKTELVKVLTNQLFDSPDALIRLDMSEYMEKHSASKLVGSPPGYVGYDDAGQLTEKVRQNPYSVVLFDEIEKAHPDVLNILLQILDEGRITDSHGRKVNFENTVIVMTSNAGSDRKGGALGFGTENNTYSKSKTMKALREFLKPEFISRLDEVIVFNNLEIKDMEEICKLILDEYVKSLKEHGINFTYDEDSIKLIVKHCVGGKSGARDLRNEIRREVEDKLSLLIIKNNGFNLGDVKLTGNGELKLSVSGS